MSLLDALRRLWRSIAPRSASDVEEEFRATLDAYQEDLVRQGLSEEQARRKTRVDFGRPSAQNETYRSAIGLRLFDDLRGDIRFGLRALRRNPGFAAVAVLSLALGIGTTTAMFSLIYSVLLHPFPYAGAERIMNPVIISEQDPDEPQWFPLDKAQFAQLRLAAPVDSVLGFNNAHMEITGGGLPEDVYGVYLTENAATFFGVRPILGRNIGPSTAEKEGYSAVLLNYRFWQRRFGGDSHVIGRTLELNHATYTIVGVMPRNFEFNDTTGVGDVYLPDSLMGGAAGGPMDYIPWIKLRPHVTPKAASAALEPIVRQFAKEHPERFPDRWHLALQPLIAPYRTETGRTLTLLLAGVVLLLLIGCANCSILLLARGHARRHELAIRSAIGASRWHIVRQLLVEALVISCSGAVLGIVGSYWLAKLPMSLSPDSFPAEAVIRMNPPILAFCVALALLCGILFGLTPALRLSRRDSTRVLLSRTIAVTSIPAKHRWSLLIAAQVALTLFLMATAATAIRSFLGLLQMPLGYDPVNVIRLGIILHVHDPARWSRVQSHDTRTAYIEQVREKIAAIPGVSEVAVGTDATPPYAGAEGHFEMDGIRDHDQSQARVILVSEQYFAALRIPLLQGRVWNGYENTRGDFIAVVNSAFATRYLSSSNVLGRQLRIPGLTSRNRFAATSARSTAGRQIIGVVGDARDDGVDHPVTPAIYIPYAAVMAPYFQFLVRTQDDPLTYLHPIRAAIASVDPDQEISNGVLSLEEAIEHDAQYSRQRLFSTLFGVFSAMALVLALVGILSVVSYSVAQRTTEFGVRLALGAPRAHILWVAARIALVSVAVGIVIGFALDSFLGAVLAHWMQNAFALGNLLAAAALLAVGALCACLLPARHAIAVPPAEALRYE